MSEHDVDAERNAAHFKHGAFDLSFSSSSQMPTPFLAPFNRFEQTNSAVVSLNRHQVSHSSEKISVKIPIDLAPDFLLQLPDSRANYLSSKCGDKFPFLQRSVNDIKSTVYEQKLNAIHRIANAISCGMSNTAGFESSASFSPQTQMTDLPIPVKASVVLDTTCTLSELSGKPVQRSGTGRMAPKIYIDRCLLNNPPTSSLGVSSASTMLPVRTQPLPMSKWFQLPLDLATGTQSKDAMNTSSMLNSHSSMHTHSQHISSVMPQFDRSTCPRHSQRKRMPTDDYCLMQSPLIHLLNEFAPRRFTDKVIMAEVPPNNSTTTLHHASTNDGVHRIQTTIAAALSAVIPFTANERVTLESKIVPSDLPIQSWFRMDDRLRDWSTPIMPQSMTNFSTSGYGVTDKLNSLSHLVNERCVLRIALLLNVCRFVDQIMFHLHKLSLIGRFKLFCHLPSLVMLFPKDQSVCYL